MYYINRNPRKSRKRPDSLHDIGMLKISPGSLLGMVQLAVVCLLSICSASGAVEYFSGEQYEFSTPMSGETPDAWDYSWMADPSLDSVFNPDDAAEVTWTAPTVNLPTDVAISVVVSDYRFPESCMDEDRITIRVNPKIDCTIDAPEAVCDLSEDNVASVTPRDGATYYWEITSGGYIVGDNTGSSIVFGADGTGSVEIEVTIALGSYSKTCTASVPINELPICSITLSYTEACEGTTGITAEAPFYEGASYAWTRDGEPVVCAGSCSNSITFNAPEAGTIEICVEITDENGCISDCCGEVTVNQLPDCTITPPLEPICPGAKDLTASVMDAGIGATYNWWVNGIAITCTGGCGPSITFDAPDAPGSEVPIKVEITDGNGCTAECTEYFYINERPDCYIDYTPYDICTGDTYTVSTTNLGEGAHYAWYVEGTLQPTDAPSLTLTAPDTAGTVTVCLVVTDADGCQSEQCCIDVPIEACMRCETAWAYLETCINSARGSNNWGWFGVYSADELEAGPQFDFIAAAGQCLPSKGYKVGTVTAELTPWDGTSQTLTVDVTLDSEECELTDFHVWASDSSTPIPTKGGFSKWDKDGEITFTSEVNEFLLAVHGGVCCPACEEGCIFPQ